MDRSSVQKINKETQALNVTSEKLNLIYIYTELHQKRADYTFFSSVYMEYSPGLTTCWATRWAMVNLREFKEKMLEIISWIFYDYIAMRLKINYKKKRH